MNLKYLIKVSDSTFPDFHKIELQFDAHDPEGKDWAVYLYAERDLMREELLDRNSEFAEWCGPQDYWYFFLDNDNHSDMLPFTSKHALWTQFQADIGNMVNDFEFLDAEIDLYIDGKGYSLQSDYEELHKLGFIEDNTYQAISLNVASKSFVGIEYDENDLI